MNNFYSTEEFWLRRSCRYEILLDSSSGDGAVVRCEVSPSEYFPAQIEVWPDDIVIWGLSGRGIFEADNGEKAVIGPSAILRIKGGERVKLRNELREIWRFNITIMGNSHAENFLECLAETTDETELTAQALSVGCSLYLPPKEVEKPAAILALENRISYPMGYGFSL
jgi:hypothetical protein